MCRLIKAWVLLLSLIPAQVHAIKVPGLYAVEVPVADQSDSARSEGLQTALRMVLVKITGDSRAPGRTALAPLLGQAQNYLQQYRYHEVPLVQEKAPGKTVDTRETRLWVKFDADNLNHALRNLGVPVWGRERPSTLLWLAVEDDRGRHLAGMEDAPDYYRALQNRAAQRGIVFIYPLLDLDDNAALRASDIWAGFRQTIVHASSRYHADAVLTGAIVSTAPGIWEGRWTAYIGKQTANWSSESDLSAAVLDEGVDNLADMLAAQFARTRVDAGIHAVELSVADIFNTDQYANVLKYLSSLNSVFDVEVTQVDVGRVTFLLKTHGGELAVTQAIELGRILAPVGGGSGTAYRLLPR